MSNVTTKEVEQQYFQFVEKKQYGEALALVTRHFAIFPEYAQCVVYFWRMDMACRLNNRTLALELLREAVEAGHWYTKLDERPTFQILNDLPEFKRLVELCAQRRAEEMAETKPVLQVRQPHHHSEAYPLLFALHGNSSNINAFAPHWQEAVSAGWLVGLPQAPKAYGPDMYSWNDWDWAISLLEKLYATICKQYPVDQQQVALAGFSMGAGLALWLALNEIIKVQGIIAVAPFLPDVEELKPLLDKHSDGDLRIYLVASQEDRYCYDVAVKLSKLLPQYNIRHKLDIYTDIGHAFPPSFEQELPNALEFVLSKPI